MELRHRPPASRTMKQSAGSEESFRVSVKRSPIPVRRPPLNIRTRSPERRRARSRYSAVMSRRPRRPDLKNLDKLKLTDPDKVRVSAAIVDGIKIV